MSAIREAAMTMWCIDTHAHLNNNYGGFEGHAEGLEAKGKNLPQNDFRIAAYAARCTASIPDRSFEKTRSKRSPARPLN